ncbi:MAG: hypothetical protein ACI86H_001749 [bacterium]|jgi:hypothetical protein
MKIPCINSDSQLQNKILAIFASINHQSWKRKTDSDKIYNILQIFEEKEAIDYINYQMPELVIVNFSDKEIDSMTVIAQVIADPWLNNCGLIGFYSDQETYEKINAIENANLLCFIKNTDVSYYLPKIIKILQENPHFLFQRSMQKAFITRMTGQFILDLDVALVPYYANLISNYLFNVGLLEAHVKNNISFVLVEMLTNAIEHGNCGITAEEKSEFLQKDFNIKKLINQKLKDPEVAKKRVYFQYEIHRHESIFTIRDEGKGFSWKKALKKDFDPLAEHGRGILISKEYVESIQYNDVGNEVELVVKHNSNAASALPAAFLDNEIISFDVDQVACRQGEESTYLYYIAEGEFRVEVNSRPVAVLNPEDMFVGEMSFLLQEKRSATVIANTPGKLIKISKESFISTIKEQPYYALFLSRLLAQRLQRVTRKVAH